MKIAIGMVTRDFLSAKPLTNFLDNAEKYGHPIDRVIVAYAGQGKGKYRFTKSY